MRRKSTVEIYIWITLGEEGIRNIDINAIDRRQRLNSMKKWTPHKTIYHHMLSNTKHNSRGHTSFCNFHWRFRTIVFIPMLWQNSQSLSLTALLVFLYSLHIALQPHPSACQHEACSALIVTRATHRHFKRVKSNQMPFDDSKFWIQVTHRLDNMFLCVGALTTWWITIENARGSIPDHAQCCCIVSTQVTFSLSGSHTAKIKLSKRGCKRHFWFAHLLSGKALLVWSALGQVSTCLALAAVVDDRALLTLLSSMGEWRVANAPLTLWLLGADKHMVEVPACVLNSDENVAADWVQASFAPERQVG